MSCQQKGYVTQTAIRAIVYIYCVASTSNAASADQDEIWLENDAICPSPELFFGIVELVKANGNRSCGKRPAFNSIDVFDSRFHRDYSIIEDDGVKLERGGQPYQRPFGWLCYGLNVLGKHDNDDWLIGTNGKRSNKRSSMPGEWPVAFHGTTLENALSIAREGYKITKSGQAHGQVHGPGIYSTPDIEVAEIFAEDIKFDNETYLVVVKNRVNTSNSFRNITKEINKDWADYWVLGNENNIRPYAICVRKA